MPENKSRTKYVLFVVDALAFLFAAFMLYGFFMTMSDMGKGNTDVDLVHANSNRIYRYGMITGNYKHIIITHVYNGTKVPIDLHNHSILIRRCDGSNVKQIKYYHKLRPKSHFVRKYVFKDKQNSTWFHRIDLPMHKLYKIIYYVPRKANVVSKYSD